MIARLPSWQKFNSVSLIANVSTFLKLRNFASFSLFLIFFFSIFASPAFANGLAITVNTTPPGGLVDNSPTAHTSAIEFDITWANSWRDADNYDSVWVFVKYCTSGCTTNPATWSHATLKTSGLNPSGVSRGASGGTTIDILVSNDKKGAYIQRTNPGTGTVTATAVKLVWDYAADGVTDAQAIASTTRIKIFGIEMVYIPQGAFYFGDISDGTANGTPFNIEYGGATASLPGLIADSGALTFGNAAGQFYYNNSGANDAADGTAIYLPPGFPLGFSAFYMMKYEITQGQYADFFNTLTANGQTNRDITSASGKSSDATVSRNSISWTAPGTDMTTASIDDRAMSYLSWLDLAAYLDWAALTPMSETQFEKAARGPLYNVNTEFPWGSTAVTTCAALSNTGLTNETCSTAGANVTAASGVAGPTRVGMYAAGATTRATSGGSYWGVMDLAGNVNEMVVNIAGISGGAYTSRQFLGSNGDGNLVNIASATYDGNATNQDWPGLSTTNTQGITTATGTGTKGGAWDTTTASPSILRTANRVSVSSQPATRTNNTGGRGVRLENS